MVYIHTKFIFKCKNYLVDFKARLSACSGNPYACSAPINDISIPTAIGPYGLESWCDLKFSSHAPGSSAGGSAASPSGLL